MIKNKVGVWGEVYAARYLRENEFKIISANYVCRFGELDLVAMKDGILCFIDSVTITTFFTPSCRIRQAA